MRIAMVFAALMALQACVPPVFHLPASPSMGAVNQAPAPPPLQLEDPRSKIPLPVGVEEARAAEWPFAAQPTIAVLPVDAQGGALPSVGAPVAGLLSDLLGEGATSQLGSMLQALASSAKIGTPTAAAVQVERMLPMLLLRAGYEHFIGPDQLRAISVEKKAQRGGEVTWRSSLARLMQVEPVSDVALQLGVEILAAQPVVASVEVGYLVGDGQFAAFKESYEAFYAPTIEQLQASRSARDRYKAELAKAKAAYEDDGGTYEGKEPTSGDEALSDAREVLGKLDHHIITLEAQLASSPSPEEVAETIATHREEQKVDAYEFAVRARIVDSRDMRVLWLADLQTRDLTAESAMQRVLQRVVIELGGPRAAPDED